MTSARLDDVEGMDPREYPASAARYLSDRNTLFDPDSDGLNNCVNLQNQSLMYGSLRWAGIFESEGVNLTGHEPTQCEETSGKLVMTISYTDDIASCEFTEFGSPACRSVCTLSDSDGGCSPLR